MRWFLIIVCSIFSFTMYAENKPIQLAKTALNIDEETATKLGLTFETVEIEIEGLKKDYAFLWMADYHLIAEDLSEMEEKNIDIAKKRIDKNFRNPNNGKTSLENWSLLPDCLNKTGADAILFGGDICDFGSLANIRALKEGMHKLTIPYMYVRADHDVAPWWLAAKKTEAVKELEKSIDGYEPVLVLEFDDLMVVGFNVSTSNMSKEGLARFKEAYAKRKPIILVTHVPIDPLVEPRVGEIYKERDPKHRNLTWGDDCNYKPNAQTREFLDLVCAEDSPVKTVLAGHLHFSWHGMLTKTISEHLFVPSFRGNIGVIRVKAK
ncbi:MAG: metallophosphoesterase [Victivallales bacterium]|nr:metallophosphoesterase [Victivallales bacterium]